MGDWFNAITGALPVVGGFMGATGNVLGGLTNAPGSAIGYPPWHEARKQAWKEHTQTVFPGKLCIPDAPKEETSPLKMHIKWLDSAIDKTRSRGQDWLTASTIHLPKVEKAAKAPPPAGAPQPAQGIPMRKLPNGDMVYIAPPDFHIQEEALRRYLQMAQRQAEMQRQTEQSRTPFCQEWFHLWGGT